MDMRIQAPACLNRDTGRALLDSAGTKQLEPGAPVVLDLSGTREMDALGAAWVVELARSVFDRGGAFRCEGQTGRTAEFITLIEPALTGTPSSGDVHEGFFERIGGKAIGYIGELGDFINLFIDAVYWTILGPVRGRGFRWGLMVDEIHEMGVRAIMITLVMNFLLGLIIAMLSAAQVASFGLGIFVANLIVVAFARELASIMTAVVVSARTGAAIAAELATMRVQEEIDALRGMGLNVAQFLVAPKVMALMIVMPCLVVLGMLAGVIGGSVWGILVLGFRPDVWFRQTINAVVMGDFVQGMLKTFFFAAMIVLVGCHNGLRVEGGSRGVGLMTTRAVVMDVFFIVVIDMVFATVFYYVIG